MIRSLILKKKKKESTRNFDSKKLPWYFPGCHVLVFLLFCHSLHVVFMCPTKIYVKVLTLGTYEYDFISEWVFVGKIKIGWTYADMDYELDYKESWVQNNWCFWIVVSEKTLESPLNCKKIKPVNPKGNQPWIFIRKTGAKTEAPVFWPLDVKNWLFGKDPDAGKDWRQEKGTTEDEMDGWHHGLNGHEFEQALGNGDGQGSLACCSPWGHKESDNNNNKTLSRA